VRTDRNRVICLTNDHKELMGRIERLMHQLHAATRWVGGVRWKGLRRLRQLACMCLCMQAVAIDGGSVNLKATA